MCGFLTTFPPVAFVSNDGRYLNGALVAASWFANSPIPSTLGTCYSWVQKTSLPPPSGTGCLICGVQCKNEDAELHFQERISRWWPESMKPKTGPLECNGCMSAKLPCCSLGTDIPVCTCQYHWSQCPHLGQWEPHQASSCVFFTGPCQFFSTFVLPGKVRWFGGSRCSFLAPDVGSAISPRGLCPVSRGNWYLGSESFLFRKPGVTAPRCHCFWSF